MACYAAIRSNLTRSETPSASIFHPTLPTCFTVGLSAIQMALEYQTGHQRPAKLHIARAKMMLRSCERSLAEARSNKAAVRCNLEAFRASSTDDARRPMALCHYILGSANSSTWQSNLCSEECYHRILASLHRCFAICMQRSGFLSLSQSSDHHLPIFKVRASTA